MKDLASLLKQESLMKELSTPERHKLLNEFHKVINRNIERDNEAKITAYKFDFQVSEAEAKRRLASSSTPAPRRTYKTVEMRRLAVMVSHVSTPELRDFLDTCKRASNFNRCFFGALKVKKDARS